MRPLNLVFSIDIPLGISNQITDKEVTTQRAFDEIDLAIVMMEQDQGPVGKRKLRSSTIPKKRRRMDKDDDSLLRSGQRGVRPQNENSILNDDSSDEDEDDGVDQARFDQRGERRYFRDDSDSDDMDDGDYQNQGHRTELEMAADGQREAAKRNLAAYAGPHARLAENEDGEAMDEIAHRNTVYSHDQGFVAGRRYVEARTRRAIARAKKLLLSGDKSVVERAGFDGIDPTPLPDGSFREGPYTAYFFVKESAAEEILQQVQIHQIQVRTLDLQKIMRADNDKRGRRVDRFVEERYGLETDKKLTQKVNKLLGIYRTMDKQVEQAG